MAAERALVVDDHPLVCAALQAALQAASPHFEVDRAESLAAMQALANGGAVYRLVVLDLMLPDAKGFSGLLKAQRLFPATPVIIVSGRHDRRTVGLAEVFGAHGFLPKTAGLTEMRHAFTEVQAGRTAFPSTGPGAPPEDDLAASKLRSDLAGLTARQLEMLLALSEGQATKLVAADFGLTEAAVKAQLTRLFRVFGVANRAQLLLLTKDLTRLDSRG